MTNADRRSFLLRGAAGSLAAAGSAMAFSEDENADRIKIGLIGTKHSHARGKLATIQQMRDSFEVVGVVETDDQWWQQEAKKPEYRDVRRLSEQELLGTPGLQAVVIETEVDQLVPTAQRCVDAALHIHLEKPAGESLQAFRKVLDDATRHGRVVQMGYMFRYNPAFQFAFRAVRDGWLGNVFEVHGVISKTIDQPARKELSRYSGGSMFELGCHLIDALHVVMGPAKQVTAYPRKTREDGLKDNCLAVFEYPKATATIRSAVVEVDGFRRRQFVVCGDRGTVDIRPLEPRAGDVNVILSLAQPQGDYRAGRHELSFPRNRGRYDGDFAELARLIRTGDKPEFGVDHDYAVQESVLRASGLPVQ